MTTPLTPEEEAVLRERLASGHALGLFQMSSGIYDFTARLLATLDATRAATPAAPEALRSVAATVRVTDEQIKDALRVARPGTKAEAIVCAAADAFVMFRTALAAAPVPAAQLHVTPAAPEALLAEGIEAFRLTREYVGEDTLPAIPGWSWFDWCEKARAALGDSHE